MLGIDTSLRSSGYGVVESVGTRLVEVTHGIIAQTKPEAAAIEGIFFCKNARTALVLGQARGVALLACTAAGLPVFEHEPRRVKQAIVGHGAAEKHQVAQMVARLLGLAAIPEQEDATDALAIAICQIQARTGYAALDAEAL